MLHIAYFNLFNANELMMKQINETKLILTFFVLFPLFSSFNLFSSTSHFKFPTAPLQNNKDKLRYFPLLSFYFFSSFNSSLNFLISFHLTGSLVFHRCITMGTIWGEFESLMAICQL
jgi:hypothetical protein